MNPVLVMAISKSQHQSRASHWHSGITGRIDQARSAIRASLPLSLGIAHIRLTADTSLLALLQSTRFPVPRKHSMRVHAWCARAHAYVPAGSKQCEKWNHSFGGLLAAQYLPKENQKSEANFFCPHFLNGSIPCHL